MAAQARAITVLYDGSEPAGRALDAAARLVGYGSTLTVVGVGREAAAAAGAAPPPDLAREVRERLARRQVAAQFVPAGDAPEATVRRLAPDLLVVARRSLAAALLDATAGPDADVLLVA
jgi:hypothetical protein